jgi:rhamnosyltransferase
MMSSDNPVVAVLLATYNGKDWIQSQIHSIFSQLACNCHIYVRDDGSSDGTLELIKEIASTRDNVFILNSLGLSTGSAASNFFILLSQIDFLSYDYVCLSDQDDVWFPEKIDAGIKMMRSESADAYSSNLIAFDQAKKMAWLLIKDANQKRYDYLFQGGSAGCSYILSREAVELVRLKLKSFPDVPPKSYSHDWIIYAICRSHKLKWIHDDRAYICYRQHDRNVMGALPGICGLLRRSNMAKSGWYRENILILRGLLLRSKGESKILDAIKRFNIIDRIFLISNIFSFRRRFSDCVFLGIAILFKRI